MVFGTGYRNTGTLAVVGSMQDTWPTVVGLSLILLRRSRVLSVRLRASLRLCLRGVLSGRSMMLSSDCVSMDVGRDCLLRGLSVLRVLRFCRGTRPVGRVGTR